MKGKSLTVVSVAMVLVVALTATWAGAQEGGEVYHACVNNASGTIHMIGPDDTCNSNELLIEWNQVGPAGSDGADGAPGPEGPQGPVGPQGPQGEIGTCSCDVTRAEFDALLSRVEALEPACTEPVPEICDYQDNDCDTLVDEDFPDLGDTCWVGVGVCSTYGQIFCAPDGQATECGAVPTMPPEYEAVEITCDGLDNDCDGLTDEDGVCICDGSDLTKVRTCYVTGPYGTCTGVAYCTQTGWGECLLTSLEVCDEQDNDCDGQVDEDFDLQNDPNNCGACGVVCGPDQVCENSQCVAGTPSKVVFVTDLDYLGNLGLPGADGQCQQRALVAGLDGTFLAWLSDNSQGPSDRFARSDVPYVLPSGTMVAADWADLTDGTLLNPIIEDAAGNLIAQGPVWTATQIDGNPNSDPKCSDWTDVDGDGGVGHAGATNADWSDAGTIWCEWYARLYCFEQ